MTFKEQLTELANAYDYTTEIESEMAVMECAMKEHFLKRQYRLNIYKITDSMKTLCIGANPESCVHGIFAPAGVDIDGYRESFIKEFKKLGFYEKDIELVENDYEGYVVYSILLRW